MKDKKRKCLECSKEYTKKQIYCSKKCSSIHHTKQNQELFKMDFGDGHRHEASGGVDDFAMTTHSVPHSVLQEAKHYVDLRDDLHIVEDTYQIFKITNKILKETCSVETQKIKNRRVARRKRDGYFAKKISYYF
tara:strand:- start:756 stop:1157 length:402 start_codon:yes stop_codon:yes gene_type:complete